MRNLSSSEIADVFGAGVFEELLKIGVGELVINGVKYVYNLAGVAGANGNETDNGGTPYGIDTYNTFGMWGGSSWAGGESEEAADVMYG
jgi:hypothetical protein